MNPRPTQKKRKRSRKNTNKKKVKTAIVKNTSDYQQMEDYKEGNYNTPSQVVYSGVLNNQDTYGKQKWSQGLKRYLKINETLKTRHDQLKNTIGTTRTGYGEVFDPSHRTDPLTGRPEKWEYEKNQAFWAGAMDAGKQFILVTPIEHYGGYISYTPVELFWLEDNGYQFSPNPTNLMQTLATPPSTPILQRTINDYGIPANTNDQKLITKLNNIKNTVLQLRQQQTQTTALTQTTASTSTLSTTRSSTLAITSLMSSSIGTTPSIMLQSSGTIPPVLTAPVLTASSTMSTITMPSTTITPSITSATNIKKP